MVYEPIDCSRSLILVSGNLDEAFAMATRGAEADIDADVFAAYADKVTVVDIKAALTKRFKPEQVARSGNTHLIYTSLRHADFVELIARERAGPRIGARAVRDRGGGRSVGARPDLSQWRLPGPGCAAGLLQRRRHPENNLAKLLFTAVLAEQDRIAIAYDEQTRQLRGVVGDERVDLPRKCDQS
ncbi:hypothetical protein [Nostocoides jenkinsii]|jgi:hypothetical protein|uniref:Uncharacterized protein n=1 Tax=Nostocoides jenkinsii Ben 74 TaxID=1193518 RepID=A0A077M8J6_9MICO|nr:hypothetical protein [Tetrasphaera jenkinsii]CCI52200.1 hypothetical protein BN13_150061 [Tetrasphaera jenkinsii Ben 74]